MSIKSASAVVSPSFLKKIPRPRTSLSPSFAISPLVCVHLPTGKMSIAVDDKADQTDVEALKMAMQKLDATNKAQGASAAAREAEALDALQTALNNMSIRMEGSIQKLQKVLRAITVFVPLLCSCEFACEI